MNYSVRLMCFIFKMVLSVIFGASLLGCTLDAGILALSQRSGETSENPSLPPKQIHNFGVSGVLKINGSNKINMNPRLLNIQADGKILVGQIYQEYIYDYSKPLLFRVHPNGTLDTSYGINGYVELPKSTLDGIVDMKTSDDGTYLLYENPISDGFNVLKISPTGHIDPNFGVDGVFNHTEVSSSIFARKLAVTSSGHILIATRRYDTQYKATTFLLNTNGTLDTNHGTNGMQIFPNTTGEDNPVDILYVSDNEIYLLNHIQIADNVRMRKFDINGIEDGSFDTSYPSTAAIDTIRWLNLKKVNNDRLVIFGNTATSGGSTKQDQGLLIVCNLDGTADTGFNSTGTLMFTDVTLNYGVLDVRGVLDGSSNKDIQVAYTETQRQGFPHDKLRTFTKVLLSQYNYNGTLDTSHGSGGTITYNGSDNHRILHFDSTGEIITVGQGTTLEPLFYSAQVRRFTSSMAPIASFGSGGSSEHLYSAATDNGTPHIQQKVDDLTLLYGGRFEARSSKAFIVKTDKSGIIQTQFGDQGYLRNIFNNDSEELFSLRQLPDGSILACGKSSGTQLSLAKFKADGSRDLSYGNNGVFTETINNGSTVDPWYCGIQSNGIAIGILSDSTNIFTAKILANGTRDMTFGGAGLHMITIPSANGFDMITMKQAADGRMVVAGISYDASYYQAQFLLMIADNGLSDTSFSGDGYVELRIDTDSDHATMGLEFAPDGRLYTVFDAYEMPSWDSIIYINCYKTDGSLDTTFGNGLGYINTTTDFWVDTNIWGADALTIDTKGNLYVFGLDYADNLTMKSWGSDGSENLSFGTAGVQTMDFPMEMYRGLDDVQYDSSDNSFKIIDSTVYRLNMSGELF